MPFFSFPPYCIVTIITSLGVQDGLSSQLHDLVHNRCGVTGFGISPLGFCRNDDHIQTRYDSSRVPAGPDGHEGVVRSVRPRDPVGMIPSGAVEPEIIAIDAWAINCKVV